MPLEKVREWFDPLWATTPNSMTAEVADELDHLGRRLLLLSFLVCFGAIAYVQAPPLVLVLLVGYGLLLVLGHGKLAAVATFLAFVAGTFAWATMDQHPQVAALTGALWVLHLAVHMTPRRALLVISGGSVVVGICAVALGLAPDVSSVTLGVTLAYNMFLGVGGILYWWSRSPGVAIAHVPSELDAEIGLDALRDRVRHQLRELLHHHVISFLKACQRPHANSDLAEQAGTLLRRLDHAFDSAGHPETPDQPLLALLQHAVQREGMRVEIRRMPGARLDRVPAEVSWPVAVAMGELARNASHYAAATQILVEAHPRARLVVWDDGKAGLQDGGFGQGMRLVKAGLEQVGATLAVRADADSAGRSQVEIELPTSAATGEGVSRYGLLNPLLRPAVAAGTAVFVPFQIALAVLYSWGDGYGLAEMMVLAFVIGLLIVMSWVVCSGRKLTLLAQVSVGVLACSLTLLGLLLSGRGLVTGFDTWVVGISAFVIALTCLVAPGWVVIFLCVLHSATVALAFQWPTLAGSTETVGAIQASWVTPALFYLFARSSEGARQRLIQRMTSVAQRQRALVDSVANFLETHDTGLFLDSDIRPFLVQVRSGNLVGDSLARSSRVLEASARLLFAYPGRTTRWARLQVGHATRRDVVVVPYESDGASGPEVEDLVSLLQLLLPIAPDGARIALSAQNGRARLDLTPAPDREAWLRLRPWLPPELTVADPWDDDLLLTVEVGPEGRYLPTQSATPALEQGHD